MPSALGDHVVIPPTEYPWLLDQTDDALNDTLNLNNELQAEATIGEPFMVHSHTIRETITRCLTRNLATLVPQIYDELTAAVDEQWGTNTQIWNEVNPFGTFLQVIARASNRVFVGLPLCREEKFTTSALTYAATLFPCSIAIRHVPKPLRPVFSPLITLYNQHHRRVLQRFLQREIVQRLERLNISAIDSEKASTPVESPNDFLQWLIEGAARSNDPLDREPYILAQRLIILQFTTMYPISGTSTETLYDLISQPDSNSIIASIRDEVRTILAANNGVWSKRAISQFTKIDSIIKESTRLAPVVAFGSGRYVKAKDGLTTPLSKTYLPEGSTVAIPSVAIHQDHTNYEEADKYKPFRFADQRHQKPEGTAEHDIVNNNPPGSTTTTRTPAVALATTSTKFTSFGHGRLACPGRFFASDEMKMLFAYIIQNYDFQLLEKRPERVWAGPFNVPPVFQKIRVRRRENA